jgi:hypothetical protein
MHTLNKISINEKNLFIKEFLGKNPVLIDVKTIDWPMLYKWDNLFFEQNYGHLLLKVRQIYLEENKTSIVNMPLKKYLRYIEDMKLKPEYYLDKTKFFYLADWEITYNKLGLTKDFTVLDIFANDALNQFPHSLQFGRQWILMGHPKVGTPLHKDTFSTCAWLAMAKGSKVIRLFNSNNEDDVSDISLFNDCALDISKKYKIFEAIISPGEILYIPANWYHEVRNLDFNIMLTGNFLAKESVLNCLNQMESRYLEPLKLITDLKQKFRN